MKKNLKAIIGAIVSIIFLVLIFYQTNFGEIIDTFRQFSTQNIIFIFSLYAFSILLRAIRWKHLLMCKKCHSFYDLLYIWTIGNTLNIFLPARAGDVWRAIKLGTISKESKMKIFGSIILERIFDGICICILLYLCILLFANLIWIRKLANTAFFLFGGVFIFVYLIIKYKGEQNIRILLKKYNFKKLSIVFKSFITGFQSLTSFKNSTIITALSFVIWLAEFWITYLIINSFGTPLPMSAALFAICFIALSTMIPSSSIYVGPYQYAYILALGIYSISKEEALATALIHQSILIGLIIVFSAIFIFINMIKTHQNNILRDNKI